MWSRWPGALLVVALVVLGHGHCSSEHQAEAVEEIGPDDESRLLNPGSASESPAATTHNHAMKQRVQLARKMAQDFRNQPHHMVEELREDASTVHHTLVEDAMRDHRAEEDAIAAQKLLQGGIPRLSEEEFELMSSSAKARQPAQNDLGESDEVGENTAHKKVWSYEFARKVSPDVIHKEQAAAAEEYHHLTASPRVPTHSRIRAEAKRIAKEQSQDDNMQDLMHAERRDENEMQVAENADGAMEMQGFDALRQQKLAAMRASVQAISSTLGEAESKLDSFERRVKTNMGHETELESRMSLARLGDGGGAHDLGQGMGASEDEGARNLAIETSKYQKARQDYAIRSQWGRGSVLEAYSVELQKWCSASVLSRKKKRLHVKFSCSGYGEWLPETSKRLRKSSAVHGNDLGQSLSSKSAAFAGTLSRTQVSELNTQLDKKLEREENAKRLVAALKTETSQLKDSIKQHLSFQQKPVDEGGHSEFFIAPHGSSQKRNTHTNTEAQGDLGEGQEIGVESDARSRRSSFNQKSLAAHQAGAVQALFDHREAVANENARNSILKSQMEDIEKRALQNEVVAAAKTATLAKQAGAHQVLLAKALAKLDAAKKRQIRRVQQKARSSVWSSYQASLQAKQRDVLARARDTEKALRREAKFKYKLGDKLTRVLQKADKLVAVGGREAELSAQVAKESNTK